MGNLAPPPAGLDAAHALHLAVNPGLPIPEAHGANNSRILSAGGILPPLGMWAQVQPGSALVFLGWEAAADRRGPAIGSTGPGAMGSRSRWAAALRRAMST